MKYDVLGETVKKARIEKGLSQEQLAELLDCSTRHIMGIENEVKKPGYQRLFRLIRELNIDANSIFYPDARMQSTDNELLIHKITNMLQRCGTRDLEIIYAAVEKAVSTQ